MNDLNKASECYQKELYIIPRFTLKNSNKNNSFLS